MAAPVMTFTQLRDAGGACKHEDPTLFFPEKGKKPDAAIAVCRRCPVRVECLRAALSLPEKDDHGVFGGTTRHQRKKLRRHRDGAPS